MGSQQLTPEQREILDRQICRMRTYLQKLIGKMQARRWDEPMRDRAIEAFHAVGALHIALILSKWHNTPANPENDLGAGI